MRAFEFGDPSRMEVCVVRTDAAVVGALVLGVIVWLLFAHWEWGVSVLLLLIIANQGTQGRKS